MSWKCQCKRYSRILPLVFLGRFQCGVNGTTTVPRPLEELRQDSPLLATIRQSHHKTQTNTPTTTVRRRTQDQEQPSTSKISPNNKKKQLLVQCTKDALESCLEEVMSISGPRIQVTNFMDGLDYFALELEDSTFQEQQELELGTKPHIERVEENFVRTASIYEWHGPVEQLGNGNGNHHHNNNNNNDNPRRRTSRTLGGNNGTVTSQQQQQQEEGDGRTARRTSLSQEFPYGIEQVGASAVWEEFQSLPSARGSNAKVCIIDTGVRASHEDLNADNIMGSNTQKLEALIPWVRTPLTKMAMRRNVGGCSYFVCSPTCPGASIEGYVWDFLFGLLYGFSELPCFFFGWVFGFVLMLFIGTLPHLTYRTRTFKDMERSWLELLGRWTMTLDLWV
jgi:hypothetical protein